MIMAHKVIQVALCTTLLVGAMGAPFLSDDSANQFLRLKRQIFSQDYWDLNDSQNAWGYTLAEQASESWTALKTTAQYYMDLGSSIFDPSTARDHIKSYTDMLQQSGAHLQWELNEHN
ncbi:uncharacterized protein C3orf85 homolog [Trichosurus vulpecula]|uniref:uncharacterized protein C3orf85 homolog n=1 Tax=Trichosurus vulpecula TaxID=9337 RepID=UPI00186AC8E6|nr:uncharacterized protein C3orf85 homolog [Trichosurus vulpecula]